MYDKSEFRHLKSSVPHSSISSSDTRPWCGTHLKPLHFCLIVAIMKSFPKQLLYGTGKGYCIFAELALRQRLLHFCPVAPARSHLWFGKFCVFFYIFPHCALMPLFSCKLLCGSGRVCRKVFNTDVWFCLSLGNLFYTSGCRALAAL